MNQTHIHLLINHLPVFGSILGGIVLAYGIWTHSKETIMASYMLFIIAAIGAGIAYFTGEGAEDAVENLPGVLETTIKTHETFALYALISLITLGVVAIFSLYLTYRKSSFTILVAYLILFISLISFGLVARTGYLGGLIRHTELNSATSNAPTPIEKEGDDE